MASDAQRGGRPIEVGLHLLAASTPNAGILTNWQDILAVVRRAEELGFDAVSVGDHLLLDPGGEEPRIGAPECLSLVSALASATYRITLVLLVASTAYRNPAMLAKTAATIDEISNGRLVLGLGAGWYEHEFHWFGFPFDHRADRFEEALQIILPLLRGERISLRGNYYQVEECELLPHGPRPGGPPILIGAKGPRMMRLAARYADIWDADLTPDASDPSSLRPAIASLDAACREVGRDLASIRRSTWLSVDVPGQQRPTTPPAGIRSLWQPASGSPQQLADLFRRFAAEGFSRVHAWLDPSTPEGVEAFAEVLSILDQEPATQSGITVIPG